MNLPDRARLTVDLDALAHNRSVIAANAPGAEVAAVVKADAYGLGAGPVARRLYQEGTRSFFVARLSEGMTLRRELGGRAAHIFVLDGLLSGTADAMAAAELQHGTILARAGMPLEVALQIDTGMNRQGLTLADAHAIASDQEMMRHLNITLVMSHLGSATAPGESRNPQQLQRFQQTRTAFPTVRASLAASAGGFLGAEYAYDLVRAGISLYGGGPEERPDPRLKAVATLTAPILDIRHLQAGDRVGYGESFTASGEMRVAVIAAGYADGLIRAAMGRGMAWAAGAPRPLLAVNMDLTVVDIGDAPLAIGEHVELLGANARLDDLAAAAGTVAHEVLVRLSTRAERIYIGA
jgi:alanine racemase